MNTFDRLWEEAEITRRAPIAAVGRHWHRQGPQLMFHLKQINQ